MKFCDIETHDYESLNLQNLACSGRSISEVIKHHPDLTQHYSPSNDHSYDEEVVRPHSGVRVVDNHSFHVEGDIRQYLNQEIQHLEDSNQYTIDKQSGTIKDISAEKYADNENTTAAIESIDSVQNVTSNSSDTVRQAEENRKHDRVERAVPYEEISEDMNPPTTEEIHSEQILNMTEEFTLDQINNTEQISSSAVNLTKIEASVELQSNR